MSMDVQNLLANINEVLKRAEANDIQVVLNARQRDSLITTSVCLTEHRVFPLIQDADLTVTDAGKNYIRDYLIGHHFTGEKSLTFVVPSVGMAVMECSAPSFSPEGQLGDLLLGLFAEYASDKFSTKLNCKIYPTQWTMKNLHNVFDTILGSDRCAYIALREATGVEMLCFPLSEVTVSVEDTVTTIKGRGYEVSFNNTDGQPLTNMAFYGIISDRTDLPAYTLDRFFVFTHNVYQSI